MRLILTKLSPFARKVWAIVLEHRLHDRVLLDFVAPRLPRDSKPDVETVNPLSKVPALETPAGPVIDSRVIAAMLDELGGGGLIASGAERWAELTLEALADGMCDAGVVVRLEYARPEAERRRDDIAAYRAKIERSLDMLEASPPACERFHVGKIALIAAIDWLRVRSILERDPLDGRPGVAAVHARWSERPCLAETRPVLPA
ncbi:MAG: glutathione S-transferase N-terminal domain-containing protein [Sphingomonadaceae bacterium]|nr:glutathione S-transferase N-terminal domain-containing protein [Sphingomonadaceae bacterium]